MLLNTDIHNLISSCDFNKMSIRNSTYPEYMRLYFRDVGDDTRCHDLKTIHSIYRERRKSSPIIENFNKTNNKKSYTLYYIIVIALLFASIYLFTNSK